MQDASLYQDDVNVNEKSAMERRIWTTPQLSVMDAAHTNAFINAGGDAAIYS